MLTRQFLNSDKKSLTTFLFRAAKMETSANENEKQLEKKIKDLGETNTSLYARQMKSDSHRTQLSRFVLAYVDNVEQKLLDSGIEIKLEDLQSFAADDSNFQNGQSVWQDQCLETPKKKERIERTEKREGIQELSDALGKILSLQNTIEEMKNKSLDSKNQAEKFEHDLKEANNKIRKLQKDCEEYKYNYELTLKYLGEMKE
jgi:predicted  nucleic acid-binding Zn-ribbon protein